MVEQNDDERTASEQVSAVLEDEYRATPLLIRQKTELSKQRIYRVLNRLCTSGDATKVCKGLYEINDGDPTTTEKVVELPDGGETIPAEKWELIEELVDDAAGDAR